ncbi:MAG: pyridoxal-phosphate dependent enzyme [Bacteroidales bacterium]|nr:pyridoxal-phosphate dependent enzyme [Bacteroidales bacterium]
MLLDRIPELEDIREAAIRIKDYTHQTPALTSLNISEYTGAHLFFKAENLQKAGAFKSRGACNAIFSLDNEDLEYGVATHSSGNHAQALARAAMLIKTKSYIVMPKNAPASKVAAVRNYGGEITFCEPNLASREENLKRLIDETGSVEIHPYNNYSIIAGQATACLEFIEQVDTLDYILAPVGGGGLLSGTCLSASYLSPKTKVIGVEPELANDAYRSFREGRIIAALPPKTIADGLLTSLGTITFPIIREYCHDIVTVSEESIIKAMRLIWERMKIIVEPSAAVPLAAILEKKIEIKGKRIGIILSGGNLDLDKLPWK